MASGGYFPILLASSPSYMFYSFYLSSECAMLFVLKCEPGDWKAQSASTDSRETRTTISGAAGKMWPLL